MKTATTSQPATPVSSAPAPAPGLGGRWARFLAGLVAILLFAFGLVPALERLGPVREVRRAIQERGIDATALIYTESDVAGDAEASLRNAIRYAPRAAPAPPPRSAVTGPPSPDNRSLLLRHLDVSDE